MLKGAIIKPSLWGIFDLIILHNATILSYYLYIITLKVIFFFLIICLHNIESIKRE